MREERWEPFALDELITGRPEEGPDPAVVEQLHLVVDKLKEPYRSALEWFFWEQCSKAEVCRRLTEQGYAAPARIVTQAVEKAGKALRLRLKVGQMPAGNGPRPRRRALSLSPSTRSTWQEASQRYVSREDRAWAALVDLVLSHGRGGPQHAERQVQGRRPADGSLRAPGSTGGGVG